MRETTLVRVARALPTAPSDTWRPPEPIKGSPAAIITALHDLNAAKRVAWAKKCEYLSVGA
jgi:hypothetical protein